MRASTGGLIMRKIRQRRELVAGPHRGSVKRPPVGDMSTAFDSLIAVPLAPAVEMMALELVMAATPPTVTNGV